jgi:isoleucyl-tRNA synthetase
MSQEDIANIEQTGKYTLAANGNTYELTLEDFEITAEDIPGLLVANDGPLTVALDITLTPELEAEGMARDIVNRIQNIRKDSGFEVTDKIKVVMEQADAVASAVAQFGDYIKAETLTADLQLLADVANGQEIELPGEVKVQIQVEKA